MESPSYHSDVRHPRSRYWRLGIVGHGRYGQVYCAIDRQTGQLVSIKQLNQQNALDRPELPELQWVLSFKHPNIVTCSAIAPTATGQQLILEYCEGGTLRNFMASSVRLTRADIISIVSDVLAGLAYVHQRRLVHCDVKPENILLRYSGDRWIAKLSDFGLAQPDQFREPGSLMQIGSPAYAAPERFYQQAVAASDLYSAGVLLYELLLGYRPFSGLADQLMAAHINQPVPLPDTLPDSAQKILRTALDKRPAHRYASAEAMRLALLELDLSVEKEPETESERQAVEPVLLCQLAAPIQALATLARPDETMNSTTRNPESASNPIYQVCQQQLWVGHDSDRVSSSHKSDWILLTALSSSVTGLQPTPQGCCVLTARSLHVITPQSPTTPIRVAQFAKPYWLAVTPNGRWFAALIQSQLQIGRLFNAQEQIAASAEPRFQRSVAIAPDSTQQIIGIDSRHFLIISSHGAETCFQLFNRRGQYLGEWLLPLWLRQLTPTAMPYRWLGIDAAAPETAVLIDFKPYRLIRLQLAIAPQFITAFPWGYGFTDAQGQMQLLDRDFSPVGMIQLPGRPTAIAPVSAGKIWVATWSANGAGGQGSLYTIDLRQLDLNLVL